MKTQTFTGMGFNFQAHDAFATESQGATQDRAAEHLVSSDKAIVAARKLLVNAVKDVRDGRDPQHVLRESSVNHFPHLIVISQLIPAEKDCKQHVKEIESRNRTIRET